MKDVIRRVVYHDGGPDEQGRRRFALLWEDPDGPWRFEESPLGGPVGFARAQEFFAVPGPLVDGAEVLEVDPYDDRVRSRGAKGPNGGPT